MINDKILETINVVLEKLYKSVEAEVYKVLDNLAIITPKILKSEPLKRLFFENKENGIILITASFITFFTIYFIFTKLLSMYNGNAGENVYKFIIRLVLCTILMSSAFYICETVLDINNLLTNAVSSFGEQISGKKISFDSLRGVIQSLDKYMKSDFVSLDGLIKGFIAFGTINLVISYAVRYVTIIFLILVSPLTLMFSASPVTMGIFKSWLRLLVTNLVVQVIVQIILIIPLVYKDVGNVMFKVVLAGAIYLLYKVQSFVKDFLGPIIDNNENRVSIFKK